MKTAGACWEGTQLWALTPGAHAHISMVSQVSAQVDNSAAPELTETGFAVGGTTKAKHRRAGKRRLSVAHSLVRAPVPSHSL